MRKCLSQQMRQNSAKIVGKNVHCPTYQKIVTILPSIIENFTLRRSFYVNLYGPFEQCLNKQTIWSPGASLSWQEIPEPKSRKQVSEV